MRFITVAAPLILAATLANAHDAVKLSDADRKSIASEVIEQLKANPAGIVEAITNWRMAQEQAQPQSAPYPDLVTGNPDAKINIFEFSDYGCETCVQTSRTLLDLSRKRKDIRIIHKELPRSGGDAEIAAKYVIAGAGTGKQWQQIRNTFILEGASSDTIARAAAEQINFDAEPVASRVKATLESNDQLAKQAGVDALPAIIIAVGDKIQAISGPITEADLIKSINEISL